MITTTTFDQKLSEYRHRVEKTLADLLTESNTSSSRLNQAMAYSTLHAGKRLRPILVYATGECFGQRVELLDFAAAAIECVHCYSLIHDDLPAMDDDSLRRGKPTCHIAFDEATAILAGDALQNLAFECLSRYQETNLSLHAQLKLIKTLAHHSGKQGMAAGQALDLEAEGKTLKAHELENIHQLKTGALIEASVQIGALAAECNDDATLMLLRQFAKPLGLAFQLRDDLLDMIGNSDQLGKQTGQDVKHQKATYPLLFGQAATEKRLQQLTDDAIKALNALPEKTELLQALCHHLTVRQY